MKDHIHATSEMIGKRRRILVGSVRLPFTARHVILWFVILSVEMEPHHFAQNLRERPAADKRRPPIRRTRLPDTCSGSIYREVRIRKSDAIKRRSFQRGGASLAQYSDRKCRTVSFKRTPLKQVQVSTFRKGVGDAAELRSGRSAQRRLINAIISAVDFLCPHLKLLYAWSRDVDEVCLCLRQLTD